MGQIGVTEEDMKNAARKITRILQKSGHDGAKCKSFKITNTRFQTDLHVPVRLEALAKKWFRHAFYEPDVTASCVFRMQRPPCTLNVFSSGKVIIKAGRFDLA